MYVHTYIHLYTRCTHTHAQTHTHACTCEYISWSMQWVRWAPSVVDYLAAAVGGDRVGGAVVQGRGVDGVGALKAIKCVCPDLLVTGGGWSLGSE